MMPNCTYKIIGYFSVQEREVGGYSLYEVVSYSQKDMITGDRDYPLALFRHKADAIKWAEREYLQRSAIGVLDHQEIVAEVVERVSFVVVQEMLSANKTAQKED